MRSQRSRAADILTARKLAMNNLGMSKASIAQRMSIDPYHRRYAKQFFLPCDGTRCSPKNIAMFDRLWMFHKPFGCDRDSSLEPTDIPTTKNFIDSTIRHENTKTKHRISGCHVLVDLPKLYSGISMCKSEYADDSELLKTIVGESVGVRGNIELLFHVLYPYIPQFHDALMHRSHSIEVPSGAGDFQRQANARMQIASVGHGTKSLQYWLSHKRGKYGNATNKYILVELKAPVVNGRPPCVETLLQPLLRVAIVDFPRKMVHAVKLSADVFDGEKELVMTTTTMNTFADIEHNQTPSFPKFYLPEQKFDDASVRRP